MSWQGNLNPATAQRKLTSWGARTLRDNWESKPAQFGQQTPPDLAGFRESNVGLLNALMGGGQGGINALTNIYGQLGSPTTPLQRQSTDFLSHFLSQPAPEQRALDVSMPALQNILGGRPGQGIIDALQPSFERNLASANQQGGRFGSGNAILRSRAVDDFNLLGAQAAQQGQQTQLQAAQMLAMLSGQAGQNPFNRAMGAADVGRQDAQQADLENQRRIELIANILGIGQGATFNAPYTQTKVPQMGLRDLVMNLLAQFLGQKMGGGGKGGG